MKIMLNWRVREGKLTEALARFARMTPEKEKRALGPHIRLLHRWHDLVRGRGVVVYECDQAEALAAHALHWNDLLEVDICTVLDDAETRTVARTQKVGS